MLSSTQNGPEPITISALKGMVVSEYLARGHRTTQRVRQAFDLHLIPFFADTSAEQMGLRSPAYIEHRVGQSAAAATIRLELMGLSKGLALAVRAGLIEHRPAITIPTVRNVRTASISDGKLDALMAYLPVDIRDLVQLACLTGWRSAEIRNLRWEQVDRREGVIRLETGTTKNGQGRVFPYGALPELVRLIEWRWRRTQEAQAAIGDRVEHVFHRRGRPIKTMRRCWGTACRLAGLDGRVFHDLRRAAAQNMVRAGVPMQTAMALMGHKTRSIFDRYVIVNESDLGVGVAQLAARTASVRARNIRQDQRASAARADARDPVRASR